MTRLKRLKSQNLKRLNKADHLVDKFESDISDWLSQLQSMKLGIAKILKGEYGNIGGIEEIVFKSNAGFCMVSAHPSSIPTKKAIKISYLDMNEFVGQQYIISAIKVLNEGGLSEQISFTESGSLIRLDAVGVVVDFPIQTVKKRKTANVAYISDEDDLL